MYFASGTDWMTVGHEFIEPVPTGLGYSILGVLKEPRIPNPRRSEGPRDLESSALARRCSSYRVAQTSAAMTRGSLQRAFRVAAGARPREILPRGTRL